MQSGASFWELWSGGLEHLGRRPVVLLTLACLLGIIWADWALPPLAALLVLCLLVIGLTIFSLLRDLPATNLFLLLGLFLLGATLHTWRITPGADDLAAAGLRDLPSVRATVAEVRNGGEFSQRVILADLTAGGGRVAGLAEMSLPPTPQVRLAQQVTLSGVSLWRPKSAGTPGELDSARELARDGIHAQGRAQQIVELAERPSAARTTNEGSVRLRQRMLETLTQAMPGSDPQTYAELLASMVYGMRAAPVSRAITELFRSSGTIHLLVVSGTQVSIIAFSLIFLVRGTRRVLPPWGVALVVVALVGLALVAGMGASINRAVAMAAILLGSFACGRRYDFPTALALSALGLSLLNTGTVFDVGAQLTYACSIGVYLAVPRPTAAPRRNRRRALLSLVCWGTFGAWLFSSPIIVSNFHRLVLLGGLANLVAVPLSVVLLYLGVAAIGLGMIWVPLAMPLCWLARILLEVVLRVNTVCAALPLAGIDNIAFPAALMVLWYAAVIVCFWALRSKTPWELARSLNPRRTALVAACVLCIGALLVTVALRPSHDLRVDVLDVGAAQCVLVRVPGGGNVLLDAGTEVRGNEAAAPARRTVLPFLALRHVWSLQAIVLSHPHEDHCNLAADIMQAIPTQKLLVGPEAGAEASWPAILQVARARGVEIVPVQAGGFLSLAPDCELEFLEPRAMLSGTADDTNNNCLVERLVYGQVNVLLPADLQAEGEQRLLQDYRGHPEGLRAKVLLAAHHASVYSNTRAFVEAVAPEVVLISCGTGTRRPRPDALRVFERLGLPVWRTDISGTLDLTTDGQRVKVKGYRR